MASIKLAALMSQLRDLGVKRAEIRYDGSGDSGSIDDVEFNSDAEKYSPMEVPVGLHSKCEELGYHILQTYYDWDWYNDDGGYGSVNLLPDTDTIEIDGYVRTTEEAGKIVPLKDIEWED